MTDFKPFIEFIKSSGTNKEETLKLLKEENSLTPEEKNLIFLYCFPRPLADGELVKRIQKYRENNNIKSLSISPDLNETALLVEASKTEQYSRFMKHLMYSFGNISKVVTISYDYAKEREEIIKNTNEKTLFPVFPPVKTESCALCGRKLLYFNDWRSILEQNTMPNMSSQISADLMTDLENESKREEFLAFGSKDSDIILCKHCIIQLINACQIINDIEPYFLDWTKRTINAGNPWDKLKIN